MKTTWRGQARLSVAFWGWFFVPTLLLTALYVPIFVAAKSLTGQWDLATVIMLAIAIPWFTPIVIGVYRCRNNCTRPILGGMAVGAVVM